MMLKWWITYTDTLGFSGEIAFEAAKANMINFVKTTILGACCPGLILWASLGIITVYLKVQDLIENGDYLYEPGKTAVLLWGQNGFSLGALYQRTSADMYNFTECGAFPPPIYSLGTFGLTRSRTERSINFSELYQTWHWYLGFYFTYTWKAMYSTFLGYGYTTGENIFTLKADDWAKDYFGIPVGWSQSGGAACNYAPFLF
jgi:hypothetical protein